MDMNFKYDTPLVPEIHKCRYCMKSLDKAYKKSIICGTMINDHKNIKDKIWFCNKYHARGFYHKPGEVVDELNKFIKGV